MPGAALRPGGGPAEHCAADTTLTQQIRRLERQLGFELLTRNSRRVELAGVREFAATRQSLRITVTRGHGPDVVAALREGRADAAIRWLPEGISGLPSVRIGSVETLITRGLVCRPFTEPVRIAMHWSWPPGAERPEAQAPRAVLAERGRRRPRAPARAGRA